MFKQSIFILVLTALLAACGGGGGSSALPVTGVVAVGKPVQGATVTITDALGHTASTTTNADGSYYINTTTMTPPLVVKATLPASLGGGNLYSVSNSTTSTVNVTPLTTVIAAVIAGGNPSTLTPQNVTATNLTAATNYVAAVLAPALQAAGLPTTTNPITSSFTANGSGLDSIIDNITVIPTTSGPPVLINNASLSTTTSNPCSAASIAANPSGCTVVVPLALNVATIPTVVPTVVATGVTTATTAPAAPPATGGTSGVISF